MSHLFSLIAGSFEEVSTFGDREETDDIAEGLSNGIEASGCSFAQQSFEFGKGHFDWIEIGRIGGQEEEPGAFRFDQLISPVAFVEADVVEDDDVAARQRRGELCLDPSFEDAPVHRCIDDPRRGQAMAAQTGDEGLRPPLAEGRVRAIALAFGCPSGALGQLGIGRCFIDKDQLCQGFIEEAPASLNP